jgi:uncharacterized protein
MEVKIEQTHNRGEFYIEESGERLGRMIFSRPNPRRMIIEHTEVSPKLQGKGAGLQLVRAGVEFARQNKLKIIPRCPFAKSIFDKKTEFQDVLEDQE